MDIPKTVKIGHLVYRVRAKTMNWSRRHSSWGRFHHDRALLDVVTEDRPLALVAETLLHELLHACYSQAGLPDDESAPQERAVLLMARQLSGIIADNPGLGEWFDRALECPERSDDP